MYHSMMELDVKSLAHLIVEYFESAVGGNLADGGGVETVLVIAVA